MDANAYRRFVPLLAWVIVITALLFIPFKIISYGFLPMDDALRHAAKTISGKSWPEILVMKDSVRIDPSPGWQQILEWVHAVGGGGAEALVVFSVVALMALMFFSALPWLRRPEAWLAALCLAALFAPECTTRLARGRPYLLTQAVLITILFIWSRNDKSWPGRMGLLLTTLLVAASAWIHGSWYLLCLPGLAIFLTGRWQSSIVYGLCWLGGSFLGCALTGHPLEFMVQAVDHLKGAFGGISVARVLVPEFRPSDGNTSVIVLVGMLVLWRAITPGWNPRRLLSPFFMLMLLGWVLGLKVNRFWWDWGLPAFIGWMALEFQNWFELYLPQDSIKRVFIALALAFVVCLGFTSDRENRWTASLTTEYVTPETPGIAGWLPGPGGIVYNSTMDAFFQTFFKNPTADWRYVHGFEPGLMCPEDLEVLRRIQWNFGDARAYEPWIKKLRPEDRIFIGGSSGSRPGIPELEWKYAVTGLWIGRLPQPPNNADANAR